MLGAKKAAKLRLNRQLCFCLFVTLCLLTYLSYVTMFILLHSLLINVLRFYAIKAVEFVQHSQSLNFFKHSEI